MRIITLRILCAIIIQGCADGLVNKLVRRVTDGLFGNSLKFLFPHHADLQNIVSGKPGELRILRHLELGHLPSLRLLPSFGRGYFSSEPFPSHSSRYSAREVPSSSHSDTYPLQSNTETGSASRRDALATTIGGAIPLLPWSAIATEAETSALPPLKTVIQYNKNDADIYKPPASVAAETILITGANTGLGLESAKRLAQAGAKLVLTARTQAKADKAFADVKAVAPKAEVVALVLDLASLESIKCFPERYKETLGDCPLDVLMANAGVMAIPERLTTDDGFERQVGINHLGHFALVAGMLPTLRKSAKGFRIILVSSEAHRFATEESIRAAFEENLDPKYTQWGNYGLSKAFNVLFANELQRRFNAAGIRASAVSLHPGGVDTDLLRYVRLQAREAKTYSGENIEQPPQGQERLEGLTPFQKFLFNSIQKASLTVEQGANTQVFVAAAADSNGDLTQNGGRYFNDMEVTPAMPFTGNRELATKLWDVSERLTSSKIPI